MGPKKTFLLNVGKYRKSITPFINCQFLHKLNKIFKGKDVDNSGNSDADVQILSLIYIGIEKLLITANVLY